MNEYLIPNTHSHRDRNRRDLLGSQAHHLSTSNDRTTHDHGEEVTPREIDAQIHSKVMNRADIHPAAWGLDHAIEGSYCIFCGDPADGGKCLPHYSTDISAAWEVVERLQKDHHPYALENMTTKEFTCAFTDFRATHQSAPMAICLAALKSVGVEVS